MLCDQASDTINSKSLPTMHHQPLATPILLQDIKGFVNTQGRDQPCRPLAMAPGCTTLPHRDCVSVCELECSAECSEQDQLDGTAHSSWIAMLYVTRSKAADYKLW